MANYFGGMEGGGTKFICAVCDDTFHIVEKIKFPTTNPDETLEHVNFFFKKYDLKAIGLGIFGPLDLKISSPTYGCITSTPKVGWSGINIVSLITQEFKIPVALNLDVNAALVGEYSLIPENKKIRNLVYMTVGTGIGAGFMINGSLLSGLGHPEVGHMCIPHDREVDPFPGNCQYHKDCLEGLASGPAIKSRWKTSPENLPDHHPAWSLEAEYIAYALVNIILINTPQRIILGGGVMNKKVLYQLIREKVKCILNNYILLPEINEMENYISPPGLGSGSGVMGALVMAKEIYYND